MTTFRFDGCRSLRKKTQDRRSMRLDVMRWSVSSEPPCLRLMLLRKSGRLWSTRFTSRSEQIGICTRQLVGRSVRI